MGIGDWGLGPNNVRRDLRLQQHRQHQAKHVHGDCGCQVALSLIHIM
jgi:hypothetical protein